MTRGAGRNPGASNLSKHIKRKEHKERAQPAARKHLGQLEKHKDHVSRAKKRRQKVERLQKIKRAVAQRNPDEFNIGMTKAVMDVASGRMKARKRSQLPKERASDLQKTIRLNATNAQYLEYKAQSDLQRAKELLEEDSAAAITARRPANTHTVFVESAEEFKKFNALKYFDTTPDMLKEHPALRGRLSTLKTTVLPEAVLLGGGHLMKSTAQKRKERKDITQKLRALGDGEDAEEQRRAVLETIKAKKELKQYRFADLVEADSHARHREGGPTAGEDDGEEEAAGGRGASSSSSGETEASRLISWRREQEKEAAVAAARRVREVTQRAERSRSLTALAKVVRRQNAGIAKQLRQKADSRFKPNVSRRAR